MILKSHPLLERSSNVLAHHYITLRCPFYIEGNITLSSLNLMLSFAKQHGPFLLIIQNEGFVSCCCFFLIDSKTQKLIECLLCTGPYVLTTEANFCTLPIQFDSSLAESLIEKHRGHVWLAGSHLVLELF